MSVPVPKGIDKRLRADLNEFYGGFLLQKRRKNFYIFFPLSFSPLLLMLLLIFIYWLRGVDFNLWSTLLLGLFLIISFLTSWLLFDVKYAQLERKCDEQLRDKVTTEMKFFHSNLDHQSAIEELKSILNLWELKIRSREEEVAYEIIKKIERARRNHQQFADWEFLIDLQNYLKASMKQET